ncbi:hypothetical protein EVAR_93107_1 [Eumeta japonica]|uniref:Uncharacterized protein n=1 Tax=Eumeta variegata TaxID=151549 RepID=A0A4C1TF92_EUMVA|nr:hypothetical protein EVAR_93107_1 [Eumeta japonica]
MRCIQLQTAQRNFIENVAVYDGGGAPLKNLCDVQYNAQTCRCETPKRELFRPHEPSEPIKQLARARADVGPPQSSPEIVSYRRLFAALGLARALDLCAPHIIQS